MKKKLFPCLSSRAALFSGLLLGFSGGLLCVLTVLAVRGALHPALPCVCAPIFAALVYWGWRWVCIPYRETEKLLRLFASGYTMQGITELRCPPSPGTEAAVRRFLEFLNRGELISATKRQAQYLALQNQINPHFLYNTLEGIRGEALMAGLDNVAQMTEALATFFRYTISNMERLVTLEDELTNIENYSIIQQYRFGERLSLQIDCGGDRAGLLNCRLPKLTLQPIVENAIFHGIERKVGKGAVRVKLETTPRRLIITVSDDGLGIEPSRLTELNDKLKTQSLDYVKPDGEQKGGIAMINVNNRIRLLFGEEYGLTIYSTVGFGTDVEITLPRITGNEVTS